MAGLWNRGRAAPTDIRRDAERSRGIDEFLAERVPADGPGLALAVVASGTVVHAAGYGLADIDSRRPIVPEAIFHLASCGKQFTAVGILMLAEERKLDLDDPIGKHFAPLAGFGPEVTLKQLLHHTSGIRDFYDEAGIDEVLERWKRPTNADMIRLYAELGCPMAEDGIQPGDVFSYSNSGYDLLGSVIEQTSSQSYRDFFDSRVFRALGMKDTFSLPDAGASESRRATGYGRGAWGGLEAQGGSEFDGLVGSGSFYTTLGDLCIYDQALNSNKLVSAASMREAFASGRTNDGEPTNYGFGWYLGAYNDMPFADHEGAWIGFRSYICRYLEQPLSIFVLSNRPEIDFPELANVVTDAFS